jgi:hypothetical protein
MRCTFLGLLSSVSGTGGRPKATWHVPVAQQDPRGDRLHPAFIVDRKSKAIPAAGREGL